MTDLEALQDSLESAGKSLSQWKTWSNNGLEAINRYFSWDAHVCNYIALMQKRLKYVGSRSWTIQKNTSKNSLHQKLLLLDLDNNLEQFDIKALTNLRTRLKEYSERLEIKSKDGHVVSGKVDNIYEAVVVMSGQAKRVLDERIVQESIKDAEEEDYGVFDEVEEKSPEDYIELEKTTSVAINQFIDGEVKWRKKENIV